jgi:hypothetical protein
MIRCSGSPIWASIYEIFTYDPWLISRPGNVSTSIDDLSRRFGHMNGPDQASSNILQKSL